MGGGTVKGIKGEDYLKKSLAIKEYQFHFEVGDFIGDCLNDSARIGFYIAGTESREELDNVIREVEKNFAIIV